MMQKTKVPWMNRSKRLFALLTFFSMLTQQRAAQAQAWMSELNEWVRSAIASDLLPTPGGDTSSAVKIAVLDTGAKFTDFVLSNQYEHRLREVRNWHDASAPAPDSGILMLDGDDDDGRGTYSTSLLLNTTQETDCLVYVAKVLGRASDIRPQQNPLIAEAIAKV